jgi:hypothetical protein
MNMNDTENKIIFGAAPDRNLEDEDSYSESDIEDIEALNN